MAGELNPVLMRAWCVQVARGLMYEDIQPRGVPYLRRYFVAGWNPHTRTPGGGLYLHHFVGSDPDDAVHSHPWAFGLSVILVGGYVETRCTEAGEVSTRTYGPGDLNRLSPRDRHRVTLIGPEAWTLLARGDYLQSWQFFPPC